MSSNASPPESNRDERSTIPGDQHPNLAAWIESRLQTALAPEHLLLVDDSASHAGHAGAKSGSHYNLTIVSSAFAGKRPVARHRLVYDALADAMRQGIHALAIAAYTPQEYENRTD